MKVDWALSSFSLEVRCSISKTERLCALFGSHYEFPSEGLKLLSEYREVIALEKEKGGVLHKNFERELEI